MATERHVFKSDMELNGVLTVMKKNALLSNVRYNKPSLSLHDIRHQTSDIRHQTSDIRHQTSDRSRSRSRLARGPFFAVRFCILNFLAHFDNIWKLRMVDGGRSQF